MTFICSYLFFSVLIALVLLENKTYKLPFSFSQEIDGRALTLLSLDEIHKCLGVTLGPAIKLHFSVQNLLKKHR